MTDWMAPDPRLLRRIGGGESADVFLLPPDRVLKLLKPGLARSLAEREYAAARLALDMGLCVPEPIALAWSAGRHGMIFEHLPEPALLRQTRRLPGAVLATLAGMARYQAGLHRIVAAAGVVPDAHEVLAARLDTSLAPARLAAQAHAALDRLPVGDRLLHGDLHLGNIIHAPAGLAVVDWSQAMRGDPAADVARTELVMRFGRYGPALRRHRWLRAARHAAADWYLFCYRQITGMTPATIDAWRLPVAAAWWRAGSATHVPSLAAYLARRWPDDRGA